MKTQRTKALSKEAFHTLATANPSLITTMLSNRIAVEFNSNDEYLEKLDWLVENATAFFYFETGNKGYPNHVIWFESEQDMVRFCLMT